MRPDVICLTRGGICRMGCANAFSGHRPHCSSLLVDVISYSCKARHIHYVNFAMRWGTTSKWAYRRRTNSKWGSSVSGHWMGHLLSGELLLEWWSWWRQAANESQRLKWASDQPFYFFLPHVFFTKYTNTLLVSNAKLIKWVVERP